MTGFEPVSHPMFGLTSGEDEIYGRLAAIAITLEVERDSLSVIETVDSGAFQRGHMDENVLRPACGCDKAKTFSCVEPFHGASGHRDVPFMGAARKMRRLGKAEDLKLSRKGQVRKTEIA